MPMLRNRIIIPLWSDIVGHARTPEGQSTVTPDTVWEGELYKIYCE